MCRNEINTLRQTSNKNYRTDLYDPAFRQL